MSVRFEGPGRWLLAALSWLALAGCGSTQGAGRAPYLMVSRAAFMAQAAPLAQATPSLCKPYDPSLVCCIKKFPFTPVESCAAAPADIFEALNGLKMAIDDGEFANNANLPEWKQRCIKSFVNCIDSKWTGNCYNCMRSCEGQREWPVRACKPSASKR